MKSPYAKSQNSDDALESALRETAPTTEFPPDLHSSIMRAVRTTDLEKRTRFSPFARFQQFAVTRWLPVTGVAALLLFGLWLALPHYPERGSSNDQTLLKLSSAYTASQELMDTLPSVTVGPLSDELDKVNQDLSRTGDFLLATLP